MAKKANQLFLYQFYARNPSALLAAHLYFSYMQATYAPKNFYNCKNNYQDSLSLINYPHLDYLLHTSLFVF